MELYLSSPICLHGAYRLKVKVKCTLVQALRLCTGRTAYRGSRYSSTLLDHGTRIGQHHPSAALYPGKDLVPNVQEAGWAPGPVCTVAENLALTGIRYPDCPAGSQSLYRLSYQAHTYKDNFILLPGLMNFSLSLSILYLL